MQRHFELLDFGILADANRKPRRVASLQIPYLLSIALLVVDFLPGFDPSLKLTFKLLDKLDLAFASLLQGRDIDTGEILPGFEGGRGVNATEKVRIRSLVERTRICVVDVMSGKVNIGESEEQMETDEDESMDEDGDDDDNEGYLWEMEIATVYDRTIGELGGTLDSAPIGIVTDG